MKQMFIHEHQFVHNDGTLLWLHIYKWLNIGCKVVLMMLVDLLIFQALLNGFLNFEEFDVDEYEHFEVCELWMELRFYH